MKVKVTGSGVNIPRRMLHGADEAEIHEEGDRIIVVPMRKEAPLADLGKNPVDCGAPDASERHDHYLYKNV